MNTTKNVASTKVRAAWVAPSMQVVVMSAARNETSNGNFDQLGIDFSGS